jgi:WD40 repeat protein
VTLGVTSNKKLRSLGELLLAARTFDRPNRVGASLSVAAGAHHCRPDGTLLAATGRDGTGHLWNLQTGKTTVLPSAHGTLGQVAFSPDGQMIVATASVDGTAIVTNVRNGQENVRLPRGGQSLFGVAFSPDSNYLLIGSDLDGVIGLWIIGDNSRPRSDSTDDQLRRQSSPQRLTARRKCKEFGSWQPPNVLGRYGNRAPR